MKLFCGMLATGTVMGLLGSGAHAAFTPVIADVSSQIFSPSKLLDGNTNQAPGWCAVKDDAAPYVVFDLTSDGTSGAGDLGTVNLGTLTLWANNDGGYGLAGSVDIYYSADTTALYNNGTTNLTLLGSGAHAAFTPVIADVSSQIFSPSKLLDGNTNQAPGWCAVKDDAAPYVVFDLTSDGTSGAGDLGTVNLGTMTLWANNDGGYGLAGSVDVYYSADTTALYNNGTTNLTLLGSYPVSTVNSTPTVIDFGGVAAQFVKVAITSSGGSHGPLGNMDIEGPGFSEAQFATAVAAPEPASLGVLALGALGLLGRRRRR